MPKYACREVLTLSERAILKPGLKAMLPQIEQLCIWIEDHGNRGFGLSQLETLLPDVNVRYILTGPESEYLNRILFWTRGNNWFNDGFYVRKKPHWSEALDNLVATYADQFYPDSALELEVLRINQFLHAHGLSVEHELFTEKIEDR